MNKYSFAEAKIGDYFIHISTGSIYQWTYTKTNFIGNVDYHFLDVKTNEQWLYSKADFMKKLKPAPAAFKVLYEETKT